MTNGSVVYKRTGDEKQLTYFLRANKLKRIFWLFHLRDSYGFALMACTAHIIIYRK